MGVIGGGESLEEDTFHISRSLQWKLIGNGCWRSYGRGEEPGKGIFLLLLMIQVEFDSSDQVVISAMELSRFLDTYSVSETI